MTDITLNLSTLPTVVVRGLGYALTGMADVKDLAERVTARAQLTAVILELEKRHVDCSELREMHRSKGWRRA